MFNYHDTTLHCEGVALRSIVDRVGTPVYVYSRASISGAYRAFDEAFAGYPHTLHYALKANSTLAIARLLRQLGASADANSGGEIDVALRAGFSPSMIVFTGVGKTAAEIEKAIRTGVKAINVESPGELRRIHDAARRMGFRAPVAVRVNPDIDARSHPHISTGKRANKFGVSIELARGLYREALEMPAIAPIGVHVHIGSQILDIEPLVAAAKRVTSLALDLLAEGVPLEHLDLGGGVGIPYDNGEPLAPARYAEAIVPVVAASALHLLLEPGRILVGPAGVLVTRVVDVKSAPGAPCFLVTDAGMTELLRPAFYGAYHRIQPVEPRSGPEVVYDVVGPLCETSDTLGRDRRLPVLEPGDLVAVRDAGAYGSAMGSNYNRRLFPPEVMVSGEDWRVIRRRQTLEELLALEE